MASQWLCSFSRPSGWLPDGLELIQVIGMASRRPGAHPGHREAIPMAWKAIPMAWRCSRAIPTAWSSSRPSECIPTAWKQIFKLVQIFEPKNGGSILRIESNSNTRINSIQSAMPWLGGDG
ncbi:hypothetical protein H4Q26_015615 [Puccinia striiformis f. sp. tritici PST-130]|nr:hypothetical protein H4Q26_015615 [Puccinia striiformis f. sp. tritici PST-130]